MMRYLVVLYMGLVTVLVIDGNPLWALPLLLVVASFFWNVRWPGVIGIILYSTLTLSRIDDASFTNLIRLLAYGAGLLLPTILMLELVISPKPYRLERTSLIPVLIMTGLIGVFFLALFLLMGYSRIGIYIHSDVTVQVYILIALTLFLAGPVLLTSRKPSGSGGGKRSETMSIDKNE